MLHRLLEGAVHLSRCRGAGDHLVVCQSDHLYRSAVACLSCSTSTLGEIDK